MAVLEGSITNYVDQEYAENQNDYVLGSVHAEVTVTAVAFGNLLLGWVDNYVADAYVEDQDDYVLGVWRTQFTQVTNGDFAPIQEGTASIASSSTLTCVATNALNLAGADDYAWTDTTTWDQWLPYEHWGTDSGQDLHTSISVTANASLILASYGSLEVRFTVPNITAKNNVRDNPAFGGVFSQTAIGSYRHFGVSSPVAQFTTAQSAEVTADAAGTLASAFTVVAQGLRVVLGTSSITATSTVSAIADVAFNSSDITMSSEFTQITLGTKFIEADGTLGSAFSQTTVAGVTAEAVSDMASAFAQTAGDAIVFVGDPDPIEFVATVTQTSTAIVGQGAVTILTASLAMIARARVEHEAEARFEAFYTQLTAGRELQSDPYRRQTVAQETRICKVIPDTRLLTVDGESRVLHLPVPPLNATTLRRVA